MDDKHLLNLAKEISEIINKSRVYNANIITELHANENAHSRILRMFLQYDDGKKEYPILRKFLEIPKVKKIFGNKGFKNPVFSNEQERIDVLIEEPPSFAIIVENKIKGATDQERQLERYIESVNAHDVPYDNIYAIYLTDSGDKEVSKHSFTDGAKVCLGYKDENDMGRFVPMNYRYDILPWLEKEVLPNCIEKEELLISALKQYIDYLKNMFYIMEDEVQKSLIEEKLKKEIGINAEELDIDALGKCLKTIDELECLKSRVINLKDELIRTWKDEHIKKPFEEYLKSENPEYRLNVSFVSFNEFDIAVYSENWEKYYFMVQKKDGLNYGLYNKDQYNPYTVKEGTFKRYRKSNWWPACKKFNSADLCESDFWRLVRNGDFVKNLIEMFKDVLENIEKQ